MKSEVMMGNASPLNRKRRSMTKADWNIILRNGRKNQGSLLLAMTSTNDFMGHPLLSLSSHCTSTQGGRTTVLVPKNDRTC